MNLKRWAIVAGFLLVAGLGMMLFLPSHTEVAVASATNWQDSGDSATVDEPLPELPSTEVKAIQQVLDDQVKAWNSGDIAGFMAGYWHSKDLTFASGGDVTRGWQATHDRYQKRYSPPDAMGHLWFDGLEFQGLGNGTALVLGQWHLKTEDDGTESIAEGNFSLVMKQFKSGWKVVHDHTSLRKPTE